MLNEQDTHSGCIIFESKTGIPITPYKECMIDGSELPNATVARVLIQGAGMAQRALASHQICVPGSIIFLLLLLLLSLFICNGTGGIITLILRYIERKKKLNTCFCFFTDGKNTKRGNLT